MPSQLIDSQRMAILIISVVKIVAFFLQEDTQITDYITNFTFSSCVIKNIRVCKIKVRFSSFYFALSSVCTIFAVAKQKRNSFMDDYHAENMNL